MPEMQCRPLVQAGPPPQVHDPLPQPSATLISQAVHRAPAGPQKFTETGC